jgi:hypothetical protein
MAEILKKETVGKIKYAWVTTGEDTAQRFIYDKDEIEAKKKGDKVKERKDRLKVVQERIKELEK